MGLRAKLQSTDKSAKAKVFEGAWLTPTQVQQPPQREWIVHQDDWKIMLTGIFADMTEMAASTLAKKISSEQRSANML